MIVSGRLERQQRCEALCVLRCATISNGFVRRRDMFVFVDFPMEDHSPRRQAGTQAKYGMVFWSLPNSRCFFPVVYITMFGKAFSSPDGRGKLLLVLGDGILVLVIRCRRCCWFGGANGFATRRGRKHESLLWRGMIIDLAFLVDIGS